MFVAAASAASRDQQHPFRVSLPTGGVCSSSSSTFTFFPKHFKIIFRFFAVSGSKDLRYPQKIFLSELLSCGLTEKGRTGRSPVNRGVEKQCRAIFVKKWLH